MVNIFDKYKIFDIDPGKLRSRDFYKNFVIDEREKFWGQRSVLNKADDQSCCFLCGNKKDNKKFLEHNGYELFECANCSLVFANIAVDDVYNQTVYDNVQYEEMIQKEVLDTYEYRKKTFGRERLQYIFERCDFDRDKEILLDVGCGPGYFLSHLKDETIISEGIELTDYLVEVCQQKGLNVSKKEIVQLDNDKYKIITMFDVLEHLSHPVDFFATLQQKLLSGGYIVMYTPNIHSFAFYFQKGKQNLLLPYEHLCFYNELSLNYLAQQTGFEVKSVEYFGLDIVDYLAMKEYEDEISYNEKLKEIIPYLQALIDRADIANHMRIIFQKSRE